MSTSSNPQLNPNAGDQAVEQVRRQIDRLFVEVAQLSEQDVPPNDYYANLMQRVLAGLNAPAGAVWLRTPQGNLQLQYQINMQQVGLGSDEARQAHHELLRQACQSGKPQMSMPHSSSGEGEGGAPAAANQTDFVILLAPILVDKVVAGLIEVMHDGRRKPEVLRMALDQYMVQMAALASLYSRNHQLRTMIGQQQIWTQLEAFAKQIHGSLRPTECAYLIANESRRLIACDRVSIVVRRGKKTSVEATSGVDVVEKRSNLVQLMNRLADQVLKWGERLVYAGSRDEGLPPDLLTALDLFLAESNSKFLVVQPLRDERDTDEKKPARSALVLESFDPPVSTDQMLAKLEVVARHSTSALYNSLEHERIPMRWVWMPIAQLQEGLGGKTRAIVYGVAGGLLFLILFMIICPYPLKMDASGKLLPEERRWTFSSNSNPSQVMRFAEGLKTGSEVGEGQPLIELFDPLLDKQIRELKGKIRQALAAEDGLGREIVVNKDQTQQQRLANEQEQKRLERVGLEDDLRVLLRMNNALQDPGHFEVRSPMRGVVLNSDFRENLMGKSVRGTDPLLRIGNKDGPWEVELKIPQKHIGQVLYAFEGKPDNEELDVDLLIMSSPTLTGLRGKLARNKISFEAVPSRDDPNESEPMVAASVRIEGSDIPLENQIPRGLLVVGSDVHAKIRCGNRPMIYSLFYGMWEFFYEKVVWFF